MAYQQQELVASIDIGDKPHAHMAYSVTIPGRTLAIVCVYNTLKPHQSGSMYEMEPNDMILDKYPNICIIPMMHNVDVHRTEYLPLVIINLSQDDISLSKGEIMGFMQMQSLEISEIMMETSTEPSAIICEDKVYAQYTAAIKNLLPINLPNFIQIIHIYTRIYTFIHLLYTLDFREY